MSINETYVMSTLSEASYADFRRALQPDGSFSVHEVKAALIGDADFSEVQATAFVTQWGVVDHQPNTIDGFSATLFEKLDADQQGTGKYTLAVRGTEIDDPRSVKPGQRQIIGNIRSKSTPTGFLGSLKG